MWSALKARRPGHHLALAVVLVTVAALLAGAGAAAAEPPPLSGTYSSVCVHPESGDLLGLELSFITATGESHVLSQTYEGGALAPQLLKISRRDGVTQVSGEGASDSHYRLQRDGARLRVTYLDGQRSAAGTTTETLRAATALWAGGEPPTCGASREQAKRVRGR